MHGHANARRTPRGRAEVFQAVEAVEAGMTVSAACLALKVSRRFYYRWLPGWRANRDAGAPRPQQPATPQPAPTLGAPGAPERGLRAVTAGVPTGSRPSSGCRRRPSAACCVASGYSSGHRSRSSGWTPVRASDSVGEPGARDSRAGRTATEGPMASGFEGRSGRTAPLLPQIVGGSRSLLLRPSRDAT